jgi:hypothetical protein
LLLLLHLLPAAPTPPQALLELKGRLLVEAALEEVVSLVAAHLDLLQVGQLSCGVFVVVVVIRALLYVCSSVKSALWRHTWTCCRWGAELRFVVAVVRVLLYACSSGGQPGGGTPGPAAGGELVIKYVVATRALLYVRSSGQPGGGTPGPAAGGKLGFEV